jgi:carbon storage regulator
MLVLSRRRGEKICIGNNVVITIIGICGANARIGVEAPRAIPVYRGEIRERRSSCTEEATLGTPPPRPK